MSIGDLITVPRMELKGVLKYLYKIKTLLLNEQFRFLKS